MSKFLGKISLMGILTLVSRFLGLARDILFFSAFGTSLHGEAFLLAFTFPNLFRRMLGEGSLTSAFIPVYAETSEKNSKPGAFLLMNKVLSRLFSFLFVFSILISSLSFAASHYGWLSEAKWNEASFLNSIVFGYLFFVCGTAILVGALNTHGKFFASGFSPIILNCTMISVLFFLGITEKSDLRNLSIYLCVSVLLAGVIQFLLPYNELRSKENWKFRFDLAESPELLKIKKIFWIGALGAAVAQINVLVSRMLAYSLDETGSVSYLFLSSRLIELPLGIFAVSISTVLFPELAKSAILSERDSFLKSFFHGLRLTLAITLPAAVGLGCLAEPIISVLFEWGKFGRGDVITASEILMISAAGLPFYAISSFLVKAFHSEKNMKPPLKSAILSMLINVVFSLLLMDSNGARGLAMANVLAAISQTGFLIIRFKGFRLVHLIQPRPVYLTTILTSSLIMMGLVLLLDEWIDFGVGKWSDLIRLLIIIPFGAFSYLISVSIFGFPEAKVLLSSLQGLFSKKI